LFFLLVELLSVVRAEEARVAFFALDVRLFVAEVVALLPAAARVDVFFVAVAVLLLPSPATVSVSASAFFFLVAVEERGDVLGSAAEGSPAESLLRAVRRAFSCPPC
jgi:hypothetical protein